MLLNPYVYKKINKENFVSLESVKKANITFRRRKIYIVKRYEPAFMPDVNNKYILTMDGYVQNNMVILVNISKSKDVRTDSDKYIRSIYSFAYFSRYGMSVSDFKNARLRLKYGTTTGYEYFDDYYKDEFYRDLGFTFCYNENEDPVEVNLGDIDSDIDENGKPGKISVVDPRYYTDLQFKIDNNLDIYEDTDNILNLFDKTRYFNGNELIDDVTEIYYVEENKDNILSGTKISDKNKSMIPVNGTFVYEKMEKINDLNMIPFNMFLLNSQSCFGEYKFIYDSKYRNTMKDILSDKYLMEYRRSDYIKMMMNKMLKYCKRLEKIYGNIRVQYYSNEIVDKVNVIFDDNDYESITVALDKDSTLERLMVYVTDKYELEYIKRNIPDLECDEYFSYV